MDGRTIARKQKESEENMKEYYDIYGTKQEHRSLHSDLDVPRLLVRLWEYT